ncbi:MAG TPA: Hsp20/alpha crystallin family protein [Candidatus Omnitrophota bacterium]|nr:Hsp20/alpha crystallin family protein [Candidatus Omnitrophota bacterium]
MKIIPWKERETGLDVFQDIEDIQREMNRLFDFSLHRPLKAGNGGKLWAPAVDVVDEKDVIKVKADLPGLKKEEIEVTVDNDTLCIKGEKKQEKEIKEKDYIRSERYYGSFNRSFTLPASVDPQKVNASYKDGVLEITLPKKEEAKKKEVKVEIK